jgi:hypothetical protein
MNMRSRVSLIVAGVAAMALVLVRVDARQAASCRVGGRAASGTTPLPGVSIAALSDNAVKGATSTDVDGTYQLLIPPGTYQIAAELSGFQTVTQAVTLAADACGRTLDFQLTLRPRAARAKPQPNASAPPPATGQRFEALAVQEQTVAAAALEAASERDEESARLMLPPGFATEGPTQAVAVNGSMASLDRGMLGERFEAIGRGELDPVTGEFGQGFGPPGGPGRGGPGGLGGPGGPPGGPGGPGGRGGFGGGRGDFAVGGRGGRQNAYTATANYAFGGSALDSAPYQLRADTPLPARSYARHTYGITAGGPVRIPGVYNGTRRTNFTVSFNGNRGDELFDQYATVPTGDLRTGNFSSSGFTPIDPLTGRPFTDGRIPQSAMSPSSLALLRFIPAANLPGASRNFHHLTTTDSEADNINARVTHNFTPGAAGRGRGGGRAGPGGGRMGGGRGPGARAQLGTTVLLNTQLQYRRNVNERINVFPELGGNNRGSSLTVPIGLNVVHRRMLHNFNVTVSRTRAATVNRYAYVENVAANAGIRGVADDPFAWGVPSLSFAGFSSVNDLTPSLRLDRRVALAYTWSRPFNAHTLRAGGDVRWDSSENQTDQNARGAFVFTGLYAAAGPTVRSTGADFADFLLGLPQQASVQYGPGNVRLRGRSFSLFVQNEWRRGSALTFNLGLRYELLRPFVEASGQMVNLDVAPDFSAAAPVLSGATGPFSGRFPAGLVQTDSDNIAPRIGAAWRPRAGLVVRGGYGVSFNAGSYSTIARQLTAQPPFAVTNTAIGTRTTPLSLSDPLATASPSETSNNYGLDRNYALGVVQTWNVDVSKEVRQAWNAGAGYTHTRGSSLDMVRAPNRGPEGLRIEGVQPFLWQTSEGSSRLHTATFRLRRRPIHGVGFGGSYTVGRSRDNASSIGGGGTSVAQDDRNLDAEWGLSTFDRRHQLSADTSIELPFGPNRRWLNRGGTRAALLADWRVATTFTWQSGTPYTPRIRGAATEVARGTNGTLRADYDGSPIALADPAIDLFFNTAAFTVPRAGTFGSASRNLIIGPGSRLLNAQLARDVRFTGNRVMTLQFEATNLLNLVNFAAIDTVVNSPTFGQVLSVRPMRSMRMNVRVRF